LSTQNEPKTRNLEDLVGALETTLSELSFQIMRLESHVRPETESEEEYLPKLMEGYKTSRYWVGLLLRYQKGRLDRLTGGETMPERTGTGAFTDEETHGVRETT
jgi:hypothetical protein